MKLRHWWSQFDSRIFSPLHISRHTINEHLRVRKWREHSSRSLVGHQSIAYLAGVCTFLRAKVVALGYADDQAIEQRRRETEYINIIWFVVKKKIKTSNWKKLPHRVSNYIPFPAERYFVFFSSNIGDQISMPLKMRNGVLTFAESSDAVPTVILVGVAVRQAWSLKWPWVY